MSVNLQVKIIGGIIIIPAIFLVVIMGYVFGWGYFVLIPPLLLIVLIRLAFGGIEL